MDSEQHMISSCHCHTSWGGICLQSGHLVAKAVDDLQILPGQTRLVLQALHHDAELSVHAGHVVAVGDEVHSILQPRADYEALDAEDLVSMCFIGMCT